MADLEFEDYFKKIEEQEVKNKKAAKGSSFWKSDNIVFNIIRNVLVIVVGGGILITVLYFGIKNINIKQRIFVSGSNYAYKKIQNELVTYYKKNGYVYKSKEERKDNFCIELGRKYSKGEPDCMYTGGLPKPNFTFKGKKIEIIGMEQPPFEKMGTLVKDFIIDINGSGVGADEIGTDRVPVRIYSTGRMGGLMSPVNCSHADLLEFDIEYANICHNGPEINFMTTKIPFGYDIFQIGGEKGHTTAINRDVPFLRADCTAFGGDMSLLDDYCETKGIYWHQSCYNEYECSVWISRKKT